MKNHNKVQRQKKMEKKNGTSVKSKTPKILHNQNQNHEQQAKKPNKKIETTKNNQKSNKTNQKSNKTNKNQTTTKTEQKTKKEKCKKRKS